MSIADKLTTIAENEQRVYDAGKDAQWNAFWDSFQQNGNRVQYLYAFMRWGANSFKPKYDIKPTSTAQNMFQSFGESQMESINLNAVIDACGIEFDTSGATNVNSMFYYSWITEVPTISTVNSATLTTTFGQAKKLVTIEKLILKSDGSQTFSNTFQACENLRNIVVEGVIGNNIDFSACYYLTKDSITSIINALSTTTTGKTVTFRQYAKNMAFTDASEWTTLEQKKTNWTINLV